MFFIKNFLLFLFLFTFYSKVKGDLDIKIKFDVNQSRHFMPSFSYFPGSLSDSSSPKLPFGFHLLIVDLFGVARTCKITPKKNQYPTFIVGTEMKHEEGDVEEETIPQYTAENHNIWTLPKQTLTLESYVPNYSTSSTNLTLTLRKPILTKSLTPNLPDNEIPLMSGAINNDNSPQPSQALQISPKLHKSYKPNHDGPELKKSTESLAASFKSRSSSLIAIKSTRSRAASIASSHTLNKVFLYPKKVNFVPPEKKTANKSSPYGDLKERFKNLTVCAKTKSEQKCNDFYAKLSESNCYKNTDFTEFEEVRPELITTDESSIPFVGHFRHIDDKLNGLEENTKKSYVFPVWVNQHVPTKFEGTIPDIDPTQISYIDVLHPNPSLRATSFEIFNKMNSKSFHLTNAYFYKIKVPEPNDKLKNEICFEGITHYNGDIVAKCYEARDWELDGSKAYYIGFPANLLIGMYILYRDKTRDSLLNVTLTDSNGFPLFIPLQTQEENFQKLEKNSRLYLYKITIEVLDEITIPPHMKIHLDGRSYYIERSLKEKNVYEYKFVSFDKITSSTDIRLTSFINDDADQIRCLPWKKITFTSLSQDNKQPTVSFYNYLIKLKSEKQENLPDKFEYTKKLNDTEKENPSLNKIFKKISNRWELIDDKDHYWQQTIGLAFSSEELKEFWIPLIPDKLKQFSDEELYSLFD